MTAWPVTQLTEPHLASACQVLAAASRTDPLIIDTESYSLR